MLWSVRKIHDKGWFSYILFYLFVHTQSIHSPRFISDDLHTGPPRADYVEMLTNCGSLPSENTASVHTTLTSHPCKSNSSGIQNKVKYHNTGSRCLFVFGGVFSWCCAAM